MRFRVFLNRSEGKMWAVGADWVNWNWITLWGVIDESTAYTYRFTHEREPKPLNQHAVQQIIDSKLGKGYTEVDAMDYSHRSDWQFVRDPSDSRILVPDLAHQPACVPETTVEDVVPAITLPDASVLDAAGYAPIGF